MPLPLSEQIAHLRDRRRRPQIPVVTVWLSVFFVFVFRRGGLHAMEKEWHTSGV